MASSSNNNNSNSNNIDPSSDAIHVCASSGHAPEESHALRINPAPLGKGLTQQNPVHTIINIPSPENNQFDMQQATKTDTHPTAFLDGLRGLAAFIVYTVHNISWIYGHEDKIHHGFGYHGEGYFTTFPFVTLFFTGGSAAVAIFFVLSGYVLSGSSFKLLLDGDKGALRGKLKSAVIRRPFRLFIPPVAVSFVFMLIMHLPFGLAPRLDWPKPQKTVLLELAVWYVEVLWALNPFKMHGIFERWFPYDPPVWTMPLEFEGSMLVFICIAVSAYMKRVFRLPLYVLVGFCFLFLYQWAMACFMVGMALSLNDVEGERSTLSLLRLPMRARYIIYHIAFIFGWFLLCQPAGDQNPERSYNTFGWYWLTMLIPPNYYREDYWRFWQSIGASLLVFGVLRLHYLQRFLSLRPLRYLGKISFSLYLTHIPFLWAVGDRFYRLFGAFKSDSNMQTWFDNKLALPDVGPHGLSIRFLAAQAIILPLNLLLAQFCTAVIDEPSIRFSRLVDGWIQGGRPLNRESNDTRGYEMSRFLRN